MPLMILQTGKKVKAISKAFSSEIKSWRSQDFGFDKVETLCGSVWFDLLIARKERLSQVQIFAKQVAAAKQGQTKSS